MGKPCLPGRRLVGRTCRARERYLSSSAAVTTLNFPPVHTLIVRRAAWTTETDIAHGCCMAVAHAAARDRHRAVAVRAGHCTVRRVMSQVAGGASRHLGSVRSVGGGWRVQLVRERPVLQ